MPINFWAWAAGWADGASAIFCGMHRTQDRRLLDLKSRYLQPGYSRDYLMGWDAGYDGRPIYMIPEEVTS